MCVCVCVNVGYHKRYIIAKFLLEQYISFTLNLILTFLIIQILDITESFKILHSFLNRSLAILTVGLIKKITYA